MGDRHIPGVPPTPYAQPALQIRGLNCHQDEHPNPPPSEEHGPSGSLASGQASGVIFHFRADADFKCSLFKVRQKVCWQICLRVLESLGKRLCLRSLGLSAKGMALLTLQKVSLPWTVMWMENSSKRQHSGHSPLKKGPDFTR